MTPKQIAVELRRIVDDPFPDEQGELELFVMEHVEQICTALEATDEPWNGVGHYPDRTHRLKRGRESHKRMGAGVELTPYALSRIEPVPSD